MTQTDVQAKIAGVRCDGKSEAESREFAGKRREFAGERAIEQRENR